MSAFSILSLTESLVDRATKAGVEVTRTATSTKPEKWYKAARFDFQYVLCLPKNCKSCQPVDTLRTQAIDELVYYRDDRCLIRLEQRLSHDPSVNFSDLVFHLSYSVTFLRDLIKTNEHLALVRQELTSIIKLQKKCPKIAGALAPCDRLKTADWKLNDSTPGALYRKIVHLPLSAVSELESFFTHYLGRHVPKNSTQLFYS